MELQLFLIWNCGIVHFPYIIEKLSSHFLIKAVYETIWDKDTTLYKMTQLYQSSLKEAEQKLKECGYGKIIIIIVVDTCPFLKQYPTKYGVIPVNKQAQEVKAAIRNFLNNGNAIHGTMTDFEFRNDVKVCLDCNEQEFLDKSEKEWSGHICKL